MEFDYVVGFYSKTKGNVRALGGFNSMSSAKSYSNMVDPPFLENGFRFIDSPEGIYVEGYEDSYTLKSGWFSPDSNKAFVYDAMKDRVMELDRYMPQADYIKFIQGNVFETLKNKQPQKSRKIIHGKNMENISGQRDSVREKLSGNKKVLETRTPDQKTVAEKQYENVSR